MNQIDQKAEEIIEEVKKHLMHFEIMEKQYPGPVEHSIQMDFKRHKGHIVFCGLIHGDEVGSLTALLDVIQKLNMGHFVFGGKVTFVLGNVLAAMKNKRFIEKDLNRSFDPDGILETSVERKRALTLCPLLRECDLLFDFHQTKLESKYPFYAFGFHYESYLWARIAGCTPMFVTRGAKQSFSSAGMCIDEYVRSLGKPAITLELAKRGFTPLAKNIATLVMQRVFKAADKFFQNMNTLKNLAHKNQDLTFLVTVYKEPFSHPKKRLTEGLTNFSHVHEKQILGTDEHSNPIVAQCSGFILFPKYPERDAEGNSLEAQTELFILAQQSSRGLIAGSRF